LYISSAAAVGLYPIGIVINNGVDELRQRNFYLKQINENITKLNKNLEEIVKHNMTKKD